MAALVCVGFLAWWMTSVARIYDRPLHAVISNRTGAHALHDDALLALGNLMDYYPVIVVMEANLPGVRVSTHFRGVRERRAIAQLIDEIECGFARSMVELAEIPLRNSGEFDAPAVHARRLRGVSLVRRTALQR